MSKKRKVIEEVKIPWYRKVQKSTWIMTAIISAIVIAGAGIIIYDHVDTYSKINYDKYVKVGKYVGLKGTTTEVSISDKDVQKEIKQRVKDAAYTKTIKKGKVKKGDTVVIDYTGRIDGKKFDGGTAKKQKLKIGSGTMIPGFEEGLIGKKIGDTVDVNVTFPKDYQSEELAGQDAEFEITIRSKKEKVKYDYDKEFIKAVSDCKNKKDYEASVKKDLEEDAQEQADSQLESDLWQKVMKKTEVKKYPKGLVKEETAVQKAQYEQMAQQYGTSPEAMGITEDMYKEYAKESLKDKLAVHAIAKKEGIKVKRADKKDFYAKMLEDNDMTEDEFEKAAGMSVKDYVKANGLEYQILRDKVLDFVRENAKVKTEK